MTPILACGETAWLPHLPGDASLHRIYLEVPAHHLEGRNQETPGCHHREERPEESVTIYPAWAISLTIAAIARVRVWLVPWSGASA